MPKSERLSAPRAEKPAVNIPAYGIRRLFSEPNPYGGEAVQFLFL